MKPSKIRQGCMVVMIWMNLRQSRTRGSVTLLLRASFLWFPVVGMKWSLLDEFTRIWNLRLCYLSVESKVSVVSCCGDEVVLVGCICVFFLFCSYRDSHNFPLGCYRGLFCLLMFCILY